MVTLTLLVGPVRAQPIDQAKVNNIKAAYLFHMAQLTSWPQGQLAAGSPLRIVFIGDATAELSEILSENTRELLVQGHRLDIIRLADLPENLGPGSQFDTTIAGAHIVYFGEDLAGPGLEASAELAGQAVLLAGDGEDFARRGGMVGFHVRDQRVRINVNLALTHRSGLGLSAEFLQHVDLVRPAGGD